jgi:hypothetical protein
MLMTLSAMNYLLYIFIRLCKNHNYIKKIIRKIHELFAILYFLSKIIMQVPGRSIYSKYFMALRVIWQYMDRSFTTKILYGPQLSFRNTWGHCHLLMLLVVLRVSILRLCTILDFGTVPTVRYFLLLLFSFY